MQVVETLSQNLKREFEISLPTDLLSSKFDEAVKSLQPKLNLRGFRPGKVPLPHIKKVYGQNMMGEVLQNAIQEANDQLIKERSVRPALAPEVTLPEDEALMRDVLNLKADLTYKLIVEVLPEIELIELNTISLTKQHYSVQDEDVEDAFSGFIKQQLEYSEKADGAAENGDRVTIDFVGYINDEPFEGGEGKSFPLVLGSKRFIPGFEDQLIGATLNTHRDVNVTFPNDYGAKELQGKEARFSVTVLKIEAPVALEIDDALAKRYGFETIEKFKSHIRESLEKEFEAQSDLKLKRQLFDRLSESYNFELPEGLLKREREQLKQALAKENTSEEELEALAQRRVRMGLLISKYSETYKVSVTKEELHQGILEQIRRYPGQEKQAWDFYQNSPAEVEPIRLMLLERKTTDAMLEDITLTTQEVSKDVLFRMDQDSDNHTLTLSN